MTSPTPEQYRIAELERQMHGMQAQINYLHAQTAATSSRLKQHDQNIRDLQIKAAVAAGATQKQLANIYQISQGRVSQIVRKVG